MTTEDILNADRAPEHLSDEAKGIWKQYCDTWNLKNFPDALLTLRTLLESFDRFQGSRKILDVEGITITSRTAAGDIKVQKHPALEAEKAARAGLLQALRMLGLSLESSGLTGRKGI